MYRYDFFSKQCPWVKLSEQPSKYGESARATPLEPKTWNARAYDVSRYRENIYSNLSAGWVHLIVYSHKAKWNSVRHV